MRRLTHSHAVIRIRYVRGAPAAGKIIISVYRGRPSDRLFQTLGPSRAPRAIIDIDDAVTTCTAISQVLGTRESTGIAVRVAATATGATTVAA